VIRRHEADQGLLTLIMENRFVLLHGHRMCGKSTHVLQLIEDQKEAFHGI
jgi:energy-coupling factor transporter ATP-binding protein EcfA2